MTLGQGRNVKIMNPHEKSCSSRVVWCAIVIAILTIVNQVRAVRFSKKTREEFFASLTKPKHPYEYQWTAKKDIMDLYCWYFNIIAFSGWLMQDFMMNQLNECFKTCTSLGGLLARGSGRGAFITICVTYAVEPWWVTMNGSRSIHTRGHPFSHCEKGTWIFNLEM